MLMLSGFRKAQERRFTMDGENNVARLLDDKRNL